MGGHGGSVSPTTCVIQTSRPQSDCTVSLGITVGPNLHFVSEATVVIAEMNSNRPVTCCNTRIRLEDIDYGRESSEALTIYDTGEAGPRDQKIVEYVLSLVPDNAWVQFGVGAIPDRVLAGLSDIKGVNLFSGMLSQSLVQFLEATPNSTKVINGELAGNQALYDYCHLNERVEMAPLSKTHNFFELAELQSFVSINSAIEIDLHGQSNGETIGPIQMSGVGGSLDYIQAALLSKGGVSILAMPSSTNGDKHSKIVPSLAFGSVVTTPRYCVDYVITEYGIASLRGKTLWERADELIGIAHPKFRDELANSM